MKAIADNLIVMFRKEKNKGNKEKEHSFNDKLESDLSPEITEYEILRSRHFVDVYLERLNRLLLNDERAYENDQILLFIIDLLSRMNSSTKSDLLDVIKDINWIASNNVLRLNQREQSDEATYGGLRYGAYNKQSDREKEEVYEEFKKTLDNINDNLGKILEKNYNEFQNKDFKSIF